MYDGDWEKSNKSNDEDDVDHLNGNTLNNTRENMKIKSSAQNAHNV